MVIGHHLIWTAYGWWLPNDPRGSSSHEIRVERVADLGELHHGRKSVQPPSREIRGFYEQARELLKHPLLTFDSQCVKVLANSFARTIAERRYTCYACCIMPDHVHALIRKHRFHAEEMIAHLQEDSRRALIEAGLRAPNHPVWGGPGYKRFQNTRADMRRIVEYVRKNPLGIGRPIQEWPFVTRYDGWLPAWHPERTPTNDSSFRARR
jgi:REP element-mobilizing transposase RayT